MKLNYKSPKAILLIATLCIAVTGCSDGDDDDDVIVDMGEMQGIGNDDDDDNDSGDDGDDDAVQETINTDGTSLFEIPLSAEQQIPQLDLPDAEATALLTIDRESGAVSGNVLYVGLSSPVTSAHLHVGYAGNNGPAFITLEPVNNDMELTIPTGAGLDTEQLTALDNGALYINIHTINNSDGEVRGQIIPMDILLEDTELSGEEMVPPVATDATGFGYSTLNKETGAISITLFVTGVDSATSAEVRLGDTGVNGDLVMQLQPDTPAASIWRSSSESVLTEAQMEAYEAEGLYVVIQTPALPSGVIRGQL